MDRAIYLCVLFLLLLIGSSVTAQVNQLKTDSNKLKNVADTSSQKKISSLIVNKKIKRFVSLPASQFKQVSVVDSQLTKGLKNTQKAKITFNLSAEDATRYQPLTNGIAVNPTSLVNPIVPVGSINTGQKFVNNFYIKGNLLAWGIPFNVNFTNAQTNISGLSDIRNSMFKFDFNPSQFNTLLKSDLQQYYDLRRNAFAGLDLTGYTQQVLKDKIKSQVQTTGISKTTGSNPISQYIGQPANVTELLGLNEGQIKQKLHSVADAESKKSAAYVSDIKDKEIEKGKKLAYDSLENKAESQNKAITDLSKNKNLTNYLNDPVKAKELKLMNEEQIAQKLTTLTPNDSVKNRKQLDDIYIPTPLGNVKLSSVIENEIKNRKQSKDAAIKSISRQIFLTRLSGKQIKSNDIFNQFNSEPVKEQAYSQVLKNDNKARIGLNKEEQEKQNKEIDSVATTITGIKKQLKNKGFDTNKLLAMQKSTGGDLYNSEEANSLLRSKPQNGIQSFFTKVQSLKIGAFGNSVPGATQNSDLFMQGTHITYNAGNMPITVGYGQLNDIGSSKDANYQASDYNASKNLTYISLKINKGVFGSTKFSIIGSTSANTSNYNSTSVPTSPSSNVALTISKLFNAGNLGRFTLDVSKSTTLYYKDNTIGSDDILNKKAGLIYNGNDLIEALSFGFNHELNIKNAGLNESSYFSYSGSGYQNPGNVGYGGGGMKIGENFKKTLFKKKLTLSVRTDINNKPISYTSNDEWKTYQVQLDSRYIINKKFNISFKYFNGGTDKRVDGISTPVYSSQKYQVDGNATYKIGKNYTVSHITIGKQDYANSYLTATGNSSLLMVNYTQSLLLHRNSLTANIFYNKELSSITLIGNMLNSDITYQYSILQKINMATAATYLNNDVGNARQTGIRQTIQLLAGAHFDVDTYVDFRKNLTTPLYSDLYPTCRAELSLKYHLKN